MQMRYQKEGETKMIKVKRLVSIGSEPFEYMINDFIKDKEVIDIKYQAGVLYGDFNSNGNPSSAKAFDRALIIYKEK